MKFTAYLVSNFRMLEAGVCISFSLLIHDLPCRDLLFPSLGDLWKSAKYSTFVSLYSAVFSKKYLFGIKWINRFGIHFQGSFLREAISFSLMRFVPFSIGSAGCKSLSRAVFCLAGGANLGFKLVRETTTSWGCLRSLKSETSVPNP